MDSLIGSFGSAKEENLIKTTKKYLKNSMSVTVIVEFYENFNSNDSKMSNIWIRIKDIEVMELN